MRLTTLTKRMDALLTRLSYVTGSKGTPLYSPSGSPPHHEELSFFEVPERDGYMRYTILYTVYEDLTAFSLSLTPEQNSVLSDMVRAKYPKGLIEERRGNSLSMMSPEESYHHMRFIESLKSPHQLRIEEIEDLVRDVYLPLSESHDVEIEHQGIEGPNCPTYQSFIEEGSLSEGDLLHYVHVSERKRRKSREHLLTHYFIAERKETREREIIGACAHLRGENARYVRTYQRGEELDEWEYPDYFDTDTQENEQ